MLTNMPAKGASYAEVVSDVRPVAARSPWRDRRRALTAVSTFFFFAALGYTRGVLPLHVKSLHGSDIVVGGVAAANPAGEIAMRWMAAPLLSRYEPKTVMLCCALSLACANLAYRGASSVPLAVIVAFVHGASVGGFGTAAATQVLAGATDSEVSRTSALSVYSIARITAQIAAPAIGLTLATRMRTDIVLAWAAVPGIAAFLVCLLIRPQASNKAESGGNSAELLRIVRGALQDKVLIGAIVAYFAWSFITAGLSGFLALLGRERGMMNVGFFFTASGLLNFTGTLFIGLLVARFGTDRLLNASGVLVVTSLSLVLLARTPSLLAVAGALFGLGTFAVYPCLAAVAVGRLPGTTGVAVVLFMTGMDLGLSLGSLALGVVARSLGYPAVFVTGAVVYCVGLCTYHALKASGTAQKASAS